ncbi:MAG: cation diffusion facilitator family transporter [Bacilli bacterium]|nr:cation diffusion facilitator family transporter [Bacilli bacterium]
MANREKVIVRTSIIGILANILLVTFKAIFGFLANSVAIILDAANNLSDALSSVITIIGTKLAHKKPDAKHPYGHGRVEYLTALIIAIIVIVTGGTAIYEAILTLISPKETNYSTATIIVVSSAIGVKIFLGIYFRIMGKKTKSDALVGSGLDALFDALLSLATLAGILTYMWWQVNIEGYLGLLIGAFIIKSGIEILQKAFSSIIGERVSNEVSLGIKNLVCSFPEVIGAYDLILNNYGPERAIGSIHIEVKDETTAKEIHALTRKISEQVYLKFNVILTVGIYASNNTNEENKELRAFIRELIKGYPEIKQMHGFYMNKETSEVSFDIIFDYKCEKIDTIRNELFQKLKEKYPLYNFFIIVDNEYSD